MDKVNNMDVQLISYGTRNSSDYPSITLSPLSCPKSLDEFDLNVFDISDVELWRYSANETNSIDALSDFISIKQMIYSKKKAKILLYYPAMFIIAIAGIRKMDTLSINMEYI